MIALPDYFHKDLIDVEGLAKVSMLSLQSASANGAELYAPEANCFAADCDATLRKEIFYITVTEIESW